MLAQRQHISGGVVFFSLRSTAFLEGGVDNGRAFDRPIGPRSPVRITLLAFGVKRPLDDLVAWSVATHPPGNH